MARNLSQRPNMRGHKQAETGTETGNPLSCLRVAPHFKGAAHKRQPNAHRGESANQSRTHI